MRGAFPLMEMRKNLINKISVEISCKAATPLWRHKKKDLNLDSPVPDWTHLRFLTNMLRSTILLLSSFLFCLPQISHAHFFYALREYKTTPFSSRSRFWSRQSANSPPLTSPKYSSLFFKRNIKIFSHFNALRSLILILFR